MRSSKSRSRSKGNRSRSSMGNIVNRVFDSSGPEGKVRGTPQQIIDKYLQLTRDAQLANDRVAAENFQQHAEHYSRMLGEAQRELDSRREQQDGQQPGRSNGHGGQGGGGQSHVNGREHDRDAMSDRDRDRDRDGESVRGMGDQPEIGAAPMRVSDADVIDFDQDRDQDDTGLVETPESAPRPKRGRSRPPRPDDAGRGDAPRPREGSDEAAQTADAPSGGQPSKGDKGETAAEPSSGNEASRPAEPAAEASEDKPAAPKPRRRSRSKPKAAASDEGQAADGQPADKAPDAAE